MLPQISCPGVAPSQVSGGFTRSSRPFCLTGGHPLPAVVFHSEFGGDSGGGWPGWPVAPRPVVCLSSFSTHTSSTGQGGDDGGQGAACDPELASSAVDGNLAETAGRNSVVSPCQRGHAVTGSGTAPAPESRDLQAACLAVGWEPPCDLSPAVIATLQATRAPLPGFFMLADGDGFANGVPRKA